MIILQIGFNGKKLKKEDSFTVLELAAAAEYVYLFSCYNHDIEFHIINTSLQNNTLVSSKSL